MGTEFEDLTAAECEERLERAKARHQEVSERREAIRPPPGRPGATGPRPGREYDPLEGAGPEYREAALADDPEALRDVQEEWDKLEAEGLQLAHRRDALRRRLKRARQEEAEAAAPGRAAELMDALPEVLQRVDAALEELAGALEARGETLRELDEARELTGGPPYYPPGLLRRVWASQGDEASRPLTVHHLRDHLSTPKEDLEIRADSRQGGRRVRSKYVADAVRRLEPPQEGLLTKLKRKVRTSLNPGMELRDRSEEEVRREIDEVRATMIAAGELDRLQDARDVAVETIRVRYRAPGRSLSREDAAQRLGGRNAVQDL